MLLNPLVMIKAFYYNYNYYHSSLLYTMLLNPASGNDQSILLYRIAGIIRRAKVSFF